MKLTNEPILVRAFLGALLGTLVTVAGVNLAPEAIESILTLSDATMALLPTLLALIGSLSAHSKVDGPVTSANKDARIERLQTVLKEQIAREQSPPSKKPPPDSAKRSTIASLALLPMITGALFLPGCGAAPLAAAWLPAVLSALSTASALLTQVEHWADRFKGTPGIPVGVFSDIDELLKDARAVLDKTAQLAGKGSEFQQAAEDAWKEARKIIDDLMALLASVGLFSSKASALTPPPGMARLRADGSVEPTETLAVTLPPAELRQ